MRTRAVVLLLVLVFLVPNAVDAAEKRRIRVHIGSDLDGPSGAPLFMKFGDPGAAKLPPVVLASYDFNGATCDTQGWTSVDRKNLAGFLFFIDGSGGTGHLTGGSFGHLVPLSGSQSLWCGVPVVPLDNNFCGYVTAPGYGNNWNETFVSDPITRPAGKDIKLSYQITYDTEAGYDFVFVEYKSNLGAWTKILLPSVGLDNYSGNGWPPNFENITIPDANLPPTEVELRFRFTSDGGWSDEDGLENTDGAVIIDDLLVMDEDFVVLNSQDFESEVVFQGNTNDGVWLAQSQGRGDFAQVVSGTTVLQQSPPLAAADVNTSCLWTFADGSPDNYGCGGFPGALAVPFGSEDEGYVENAIWSPWIPWEPLPGQTTHMKFDVYHDLPLDNLVFYQWFVRTRSDGGCPTAWQSNGFVYYNGTVEWANQDQDMSALVATTAGVDEIQVAIGVVDMALPYATIGSGACHSNAPLIDNVEVYLDNTHSWTVHDLDLFQDTFPGDGTVTGTIRADAASGDDVVRFRVTEPGIGIDAEGNGPAVFCHVKTLPGKAGPAVSGGQAWPYLPLLSDAEWTVVQCAAGTELNEYTVDLNDDLYGAGDIVYFYFSARGQNQLTTYYSQFTGRVDTEAEARAYPMEFSGLPGGAIDGQTNVLYVDYFSSRGAEPLFNTSFDEMSIAPDRYDVRAPSSRAGNGPGDRLVSLPNQVFPFYDTIIWNTGDLEDIPMSDLDWLLLALFADFHPAPQVGIYLSGDNLASEWAASGQAGAVALRANYCGFDVVNGSHRDVGEPVSPIVMPEGGSPFTQQMVAFGGTPSPGHFDVITPGQGAIVGMTYSGNPSRPAVIVQSTTSPQQNQVNVVLSGFSHHKIRDDQATAPQDRTNHLFEILVAVSGSGNPPVSAGDPPALVTNALEQNAPNPFNPITRIRYSVKAPGHVRLAVYNVRGQRVATLVDEIREPRAGGYTVNWNGRSDAGVPVSSGVYFYKLDATGFTQTRKMVLLK